ncbi:hypothetical protein F4678DRAFT_461251 [Xylaria arbuscula]|nr:hypothetical protein F4678DRAFT_461251 [Xylaria arbuscula]
MSSFKIEDLPVKDYIELRYSYQSNTIPRIIEAPLNSVEIIEALLKPPAPLTIYRARYIRRGPHTKPISVFSNVPYNIKLYDQDEKFTGRLEEDREIRFVLIPKRLVHAMKELRWRAFIGVRLFYISIPWCHSGKQEDMALEHPWALVLDNVIHWRPMETYQFQLVKLLAMLGLEGCKFRRSLLEPETTPLPENLLDWFAGIPGKTAKLHCWAALLYVQDSDGGSVTEGRQTPLKIY